MNEKTDEQLIKEMIKKVDLKKCKKIYAMSMNMQDNEIHGFEKLIERWAVNKLWLYKLLGENIKIVQDINIDISTLLENNGSIGEIDNNVNTEWRDFIRRVTEKIPVFSDTCNRIFNYESVLEEFPNLSYKSFFRLYNILGLDSYENANVKVPISTVFRKLFNSEIVDIELSKMIQRCSKNITGKMYISIDPFDYLTMSMNKSNWNSCHSLHMEMDSSFVDYGCYSAGIFSYMCDEVSLIAFRTNGDKIRMGWGDRNIIAESKNWRQMLFCSKDKQFFIASRQYPFASELLGKIIREMFEDIIDAEKEIEEVNKGLSVDSKWIVSRNKSRNKEKIFDNFDLDGKGVAINDREYDDDDDDDDYDEEEEAILHYNDMLNDWEYQFIYKNSFYDLNPIVIGCHPTCPICGERILTEHHQPFCNSCFGKIGS